MDNQEVDGSRGDYKEDNVYKMIEYTQFLATQLAVSITLTLTGVKFHRWQRKEDDVRRPNHIFRTKKDANS